MSNSRFPELPCHPCPHNATCCAYGATVSEVEAAAITTDVGEGLVYRTRWGEWRTRVVEGRCVFYKGGGCEIHNRPYYPAVCRGFPWVDAETGGPYEYDRTICLEFIGRPELTQINPVLPRSNAAEAAPSR